MTKHIISEKLKSNLSSISSISESNVATTLDDAYYTKISAGQNTTVKINDSFSDVAAKIFNLIDLNRKDRKLENKLVESEDDVVEKYSKVEDIPKKEGKTDEAGMDSVIEVYEGWRLYSYWQKLNNGNNLAKLIGWFKNIGKNMFDLKWLKDIANIGLDVVKNALKLSETALKFVPSAARIGLGIGSAVGLSKLIAGGESGGASYNAANRGLVDNSKTQIRKYSGNENFSAMTVGEISRRQHLPRNDPDYISAVGKYQMIRITMDEAINKGFVKTSDIFSPDVQEKLFSEYLINEKRPEIVKYIQASPDDPGIINGSLLDNALAGLSNEFASVEYKSGSGKSKSGQRASISAEEASNELLTMRLDFQNVNNTASVAETTSSNPPTIKWSEDQVVEKVSGKKLNDISKKSSFIVKNGVKVFIQPVITQTESDNASSSIESPTLPDMPAINQKM
jgi:muramidase (phage lysozyme)